MFKAFLFIVDGDYTGRLLLMVYLPVTSIITSMSPLSWLEWRSPVKQHDELPYRGKAATTIRHRPID